MIMEKANKYGILIYKTRGFVNISKIRMFDDHDYNWHEQIIHNGILAYHTDQTYDLRANPSRSKVIDYDYIYLDGCLLYKAGLIRRAINFFKRTF